MWQLNHKEGRMLKNWCFWTEVLEKTLESPLDYKIKPVHPKRNRPWIFIGRTDAEAEATILWPPDAKNWLTGKDTDAGKDWKQKKGMTEDETVGWYHRLNGHEFEQAPGVDDGQENLACYSLWDHKGAGTTEQLNWTHCGASLEKAGRIGRKRGGRHQRIFFPWAKVEDRGHSDFQIKSLRSRVLTKLLIIFIST